MADLAYTTKGDRNNPAIVFLHGLLGSAAEWDEITAHLVPTHFCLQIDLPGHGGSALCRQDIFPMPACADAVIELLEELAIERAGLCGYSMGGRLAFYLLAHFPGRFARALIESASPGLRTEQERQERLRHDAELARMLERDGIGPFLVHWYRQPLFASLAERPDVIKAVTERRLANDPETAARSLRIMGTGNMPDLRPHLTQLTVPLLLVTGAFDQKFTALAQEIIDLCPVATHRILPSCGHNAHLEQPREYVQTLTAFFQ